MSERVASMKRLFKIIGLESKIKIYLKAFRDHDAFRLKPPPLTRAQQKTETVAKPHLP